MRQCAALAHAFLPLPFLCSHFLQRFISHSAYSLAHTIHLKQLQSTEHVAKHR